MKKIILIVVCVMFLFLPGCKKEDEYTKEEYNEKIIEIINQCDYVYEDYGSQYVTSLCFINITNEKEYMILQCKDENGNLKECQYQYNAKIEIVDSKSWKAGKGTYTVKEGVIYGINPIGEAVEYKLDKVNIINRTKELLKISSFDNVKQIYEYFKED